MLLNSLLNNDDMENQLFKWTNFKLYQLRGLKFFYLFSAIYLHMSIGYNTLGDEISANEFSLNLQGRRIVFLIFHNKTIYVYTLL